MTLIDRLQTYFRASAASPPLVVPLQQPTNAAADPSAPVYTPILGCTAARLLPAANQLGLGFTIVSSQSDLAAVRANLDTNARGFDPAAPPTTDAEALAFRAELITSRAITATLDGVPVAAGMFTPPIDGVAELAGITTLADYRGRGIAAVLTSELVRLAFAHGVDTVILQTDDPIAYRVYQRVGFVPVATLVVTPTRD